MSGNPYDSPKGMEPQKGMGGPPNPGMIADRVAGPAIGLMVTGGFGLALAILGIALNLLGVGLGAAGGEDGVSLVADGVVGIFQCLTGIVFSGLVLFGAIKMKKLENHGLAMAAAIIAMVPCLSPCCPLGVPMGIWAMVVINDAAVKAAFR